MRRLLALALFPALLAAKDDWVKYTSGPFEVMTDAGGRAGRDTLVRFAEFRQALGDVLGQSDLGTPQPVRIMLFRNAKGFIGMPGVTMGRDRYCVVLEESSGKAPLPPGLYTDLTRLFLENNTSRMPPAFEHGLAEFFSTFQNKNVHIAVGAPPPHPDLDWVRIHFLVTDAEYSGRLKVLLFNLRQGADLDPACRNAFGKSAAEVEALVAKHLAAGNFQTTTLNSRPMSEKDMVERPVSDADARLARADLLAGDASAAEYLELIHKGEKIAEAQEGLGLLALAKHDRAAALHAFAEAIAAGSSSARCYIEYAKLASDPDKASAALRKAAALNPKLGEPFALLAARDTDPTQRLAHWKAAAERNPRNAAYWKATAEAALAEHDYEEAAKAWNQAEQAATDPAQRAAMHQARLDVERQRLDFEADQKRREAEEDARDLARLKQEAIAHVHEIEAKYNQGDKPSAAKPVPWWDGPAPSGKVRGTLRQVDCLGKQLRLTVETANHKLVRLLVPDASQIATIGGQQTLACGKAAPRQVSIEYFPKTNSHLTTVGEVATIEFP
ncbi:MAG: tetratricopeptide repeat protein [Bryobacteraceae bacterium]